MSNVSTYLNFQRNTEAAFEFYRSVFGTAYDGAGLMRFKDMPSDPNQPPLAEADKNLVMHVSLPILGGHRLMGTDCSEAMGQPPVRFGNNVYINLQPDTRGETERLFARLAEGGKVEMPLAEMFWGDYFGCVVDKFGVQWMLDCESKT
jgi:PhnB protein